MDNIIEKGTYLNDKYPNCEMDVPEEWTLQFSGYGTFVLYGGYIVVQFYFILGLKFISLCFRVW